MCNKNYGLWNYSVGFQLGVEADVKPLNAFEDEALTGF